MRVNLPKNDPVFSRQRIDHDLANQKDDDSRFSDYWKERRALFPDGLFQSKKETWLEVGAGSGHFIVELARLHPEVQCVAIERSRTRGQKLVKKTRELETDNLFSVRGNVIPALIHQIPSACIDRIYHLYPCPWPKTAQRKNRWYLHPIMAHLVRILKPGGLMLWTSDQRYFIEEAHYVCTKYYPFEVLTFGSLAPNSYNELSEFPNGRSKFEQYFLERNLPSFELVVKKTDAPPQDSPLHPN